MDFPISYQFSFQAVKGVGNIKLDFLPKQRVYTLIGENGVGKTKFLESLFFILFFSHNFVLTQQAYSIDDNVMPFQIFNDKVIKNFSGGFRQFQQFSHNLPIVYISAQNRGTVNKTPTTINPLGDKKNRLKIYTQYITNIFQYTPENLKSLNMDISLEEWIIQRAQSANRFQADEDNREIEIITLLKLLNQIDNRIDPEFLEISGGHRVFIKIENQKRELAELSSGFTSILKIMQAIVAGYSYFTNETQLANVRGVVLIDEIESHLHNRWQVKIVPLLKQLFPNTTFFITTHSSLVISQLEQGEAYRLVRDGDGVVRSHLIEYPNNVSFIDLLDTAFDVNLNQLKIHHDNAINNSADKDQAKKALLSLIQDELNMLGGA